MITEDPNAPRACKPENLTQKTLPEIVDFAARALTDWPVASMFRGAWVRNLSDTNYQAVQQMLAEEDCKREAVVADLAPAFKAGTVDPESVNVCAVGAVLMSDTDARAALDWLCDRNGLGGYDTSSWVAGQSARRLFMEMSDLFEDDRCDLEAGREMALDFLVRLGRIFKDPTVNLDLADHDSLHDIMADVAGDVRWDMLDTRCKSDCSCDDHDDEDDYEEQGEDDDEQEVEDDENEPDRT